MKTRLLKGDDPISYRVNGSQKKETLVFVHGLSGSSSAWGAYEKHFGKKYNVISLDLRGHGKSFRPQTSSAYSISHFSNDIRRVLDHEKVKHCILVSHSFGTLVAIEFLLHNPQVVDAAVLVSAEYYPNRRWSAKIIRPFLAFSRVLNIFPTLRKKGTHIDYQKYRGTGDWNVRRSHADITNTGLKSYLHSLRHAYDYNASQALKMIKTSILLVHGKKDTIFPLATAEHMVEHLPNARLEILPDADHIIILNHSKELIRAIDEFIDSHKQS